MVAKARLINRNGVWYAEITAEGVRKRVSLRTKDETLAKSRIKILEEEYLAGIVREIQSTQSINPHGSVRELVDWYLHTYIEINSYAKKTKQKYRRVLTDLVSFLSYKRIGRIDQLTFHLLQEWQQHYIENNTGLGGNGAYADRTIQRHFSIVRGMLNAAIKSGLLKESPIKYWDIKKNPSPFREIRPLKAHELKEVLTLLEEKKSSVWNVCRFMAYSGWRVSDVIDLRWGEVDLESESIDRKQIKTQDNLSYPITPAIRECLEHERQRLDSPPKRTDHVFRNASGKPWHYNALYTRLTETLETANFPYPVSPHTFRHTFATLGASGSDPIPPRVLQNLLGHKSIETTLRYYTKVSIDQMAYWQSRYCNQFSPVGRNSEETVPNEIRNVLKLKEL